MAMNENSNRSSRLQELGDSDYKVEKGQPNIKGWKVKDAMGKTLGEVDELLFDPEARQVRYIVLDMDDNDFDLDDKEVLIPIGLAELDESDNDVILPNVTVDQLRSLPDYDDDTFSSDVEDRVRQVFSGGAVSGASYYQHEHFNEKNLYKRREGRRQGAQTVIGVFDNGFEAQNAIGQLKGNGFSEDQIDLSVRDNMDTDTSDDDRGISNFFSNLMDDDNDKASHYTEVAKRGSVVTVHASSSEEAQRAARILDQYGAIDIDERYKQYHSGDTGTSSKESIPIIEEELQVGKREVETGKVSIRSRIIEKPVEESIRLRSERVTVERNPVNRPATEADIMKDKTIEATERTEVPVVDKEARIVEEVSLNKTVEETDETIRDTVRNTEVDIDKSDSEEELRRRANRGLKDDE